MNSIINNQSKNIVAVALIARKNAYSALHPLPLSSCGNIIDQLVKDKLKMREEKEKIL
jgi:hypothetical protein